MPYAAGMKLEAKQMSVSSLVTSARFGFSIPDFQRNYAWGDSQLEQFWIDVIAIAEGKFPDHFMGPIVLLDSDHRKPVIDGQQRLTTLVILAGVIRDRFVTNYEDPQYTVDGNSQVFSNLLNPLLFLTDLTTPMMQGNYQIKTILESFVLKNPKSDHRKTFGDRRWPLTSVEQRASKNVQNSHKFFQEKLKKWVEESSPIVESQLEVMRKLVTAINEQIQFLTITVENEDDAFTIFETLNERGLKLSPADLIKSYILRKIIEENNSANREEIIDIWDQIMDALGDYDVTSFLRHYLLTVHEDPIQKKVIFTKIKGEIEPTARGAVPVSPRKKLEDIKFAALNYSQLLVNSNANIENNNIEVALKKLNMIGDNHRIFLLKVLQAGFSDSELLFAIRSVEKLMFRWVICGENAQVLENHLQSASHLVKKSDGQSLIVACQELVNACPGDDEFTLAIKNRSFRDTKLQAYALRNINYAITGSEVTTNRKNVSVEHIAPQKPDSDDWYSKVAKKETSESEPAAKIYEDFVYKWGNITILEQKLNSSVQNNIWAIKKTGTGRYKGYEHSTIKTTVELLSIAEWNADVIDKRTIWFANSALKIWARELPSQSDIRVDGFRYVPPNRNSVIH
jgi:uncharacterized protein with ParB-like and HNH nuclease domain